jgi:hypothetical protein
MAAEYPSLKRVAGTHRYGIVSFNGKAGPWYVLDAETGDILGEHDDMFAADNQAYQLERTR